MGFMEIFGLMAMIFGIIFITGLSVNAVRKINKQKYTENKIRVRKQSMGLYYGWLVIATFNTLSMFMQMSTASEIGNSSREKAYLYIGIFWVLLTVGWIMITIFGKYSYVLEDCIMIYDVNTINLSHNDCYYTIDDDILKIYYKKNKSPYRYIIIEKREELLKILNENYESYKKA